MCETTVVVPFSTPPMKFTLYHSAAEKTPILVVYVCVEFLYSRENVLRKKEVYKPLLGLVFFFLTRHRGSYTTIGEEQTIKRDRKRVFFPP